MKNIQRLREIDSLRGIAALSVLIFHFYLISINRDPKLSFLDLGGTGVDLFFMISGFVIFMSISSSRTFQQFWLSRIIRLFPTYWLSMVVALFTTAIFASINFHRSWNFIVGNILMLQPVFKTTYLLGSYWTLYVELSFYLLISILFKFKLLHKIETIVWIGLVSMVLINGFYILHPTTEPYLRFFIVTRNLFLQISYFCFFGAGIIYYLIYTDGWNLNRALLVIACFLMTLLIHGVSGRFNLFFGVVDRVICVGVYHVLFALVVSKRAGFLKFKWLNFFGTISYALYLIHEPVGFPLYAFLTHYVISIIATIVSVAVSMILAILITFYFEAPVYRKIKQLIYRNRSADITQQT